MKERKLSALLCRDLPLVSRPFQRIAAKAGIKEEVLLRILREWKKKKVVRRFGAKLRHRNTGYRYNAMSVWNVPEKRVSRAGRIMASFKEVSHCYARPTFPDWPYNLFAMIHGKDKSGTERVAKKIAKKTGISGYGMLYSQREFKKTSMIFEKHGKD